VEEENGTKTAVLELSLQDDKEVEKIKKIKKVEQKENPGSTQPASELSLARKELQKNQKQFQQLEEKISKATTRKNELEAALSDPATYAHKNRFLQAETNYKSAESELYKLNSQYEELFEKIMELETKLKTAN